MKRYLLLGLSAFVCVLGLSWLRFASAQSTPAKILVYCPVGIDEAGCHRIVDMLSAPFTSNGVEYTFQVERAYDGRATATGGFPTVDLRSADLRGYTLLIVPSLADVSSATLPYSLLRTDAVKANLNWFVTGRTVGFTGTPDDGLGDAATLGAKAQLMRNLAAHAASKQSGTMGLVFLLDNSTAVAEYGWLHPISGVTLTACDRFWGAFSKCDPRLPLEGGPPLYFYDELKILKETALGEQNGTFLMNGVAAYTAMATQGIARHDGDGWIASLGGVYYVDGVPQDGSQVSVTWRQFPTTVTLTSSPDPATVHADGSWTFTAAFTRHDGSPHSNRSVFFRVNGTLYKKATDLAGVARLTNTDVGVLPAGEYGVDVRYEGSLSENRAGSSASGTLTILPAQTTSLAVDPAAGPYGGSATLRATLTSNGAAVGGQTVSFSLNGSNVGSATTNASGVAEFSAPLSGIPAGLYPGGVTAAWAGSATYGSSSGSNSLEVTKAEAAVSLQNLTGHTYDGTAKLATVATIPAGLSVGITYAQDGVSTGEPVNAGSYQVTATVEDPNYYGSATGTLTIAKAVPVIVWSNPADIAYGTPLGEAQLNASATNPTTGAPLTGGTFAYSPLAGTILNAGDAQPLTTNFAPSTTDAVNYETATATVHINVRKADQTIAFAPLPPKTYGDPAFTVSATASSGLAVGFAGSGNCSVSGNTVTITSAGSCTVTASQAGDVNYNAAPSVSQTFTIEKGSAQLILSIPTAATYDGAAKSATVTTDPAGLTGVSTTYNGSAVEPIDAGDYAVQATLSNPNYQADPVSGTLTVARREAAVVVADARRIYGDANPSLTGSISNLVAPEDAACTYATAATAGSDAGTHPITADCVEPTGKSNYSFAITAGTLTIDQAPLSVTADGNSKVYGEAVPALTGSLVGVKNNDAITAAYATTATAASAAGTYVITPTLSDPNGRLGNYAVTSVNGTLTVTKAPLTVTASDASRLYGAVDPLFSATYAGFVLTDGPSSLGGALAFTTPATSTSSVGSYPVTPGGLTSDNYEIAYAPGTLTIEPVALTVTPNDDERAYGAPNPAFTGTISGFVNGETESVLTALPSYSTDATATSAVGSYAIGAAGGSAANYTFTYGTGTLAITKASLTATASDATRIYGDPNPSFAASYSGFVSGEDESVLTGTLTFATAADAGSDVGEYAVTPGGVTSGNYEITFLAGTLRITERPATVTVADASRSYGAENPPFEGTITNLVSPADVSCSYSAAATASSDAGTHAIGAACAEPVGKSNYTITVDDGTLTIEPAPLTITAGEASRLYGDPNPAFAATYSGFVLGQNETVLVGTIGFTTAAVASSPVATYPVSPGGVSSTNYAITFADGTLSVTAAPLTVVAGNAERAYGAPNPAFTGTLTGIRNGDNISASYATTTTASDPVGSYPISPVLADPDGRLGNYDVTSTDGTLTITPASLTVQAADATRLYGDANPAFSATFAGFVNGENESALTGTLSFTTPATPASAVGTYTVTPSGLSSSNYHIAFVDGSLSVTKAPLAIAADDKQRLYGGTNPELTGTITGIRNADAITAGYTTDAVSSSPVGTYVIVATADGAAATLANYEISASDGTLTIDKVPLTVRATDATRQYGQPNPTFVATYDGFVLNETEAVLTGTLTVTTSADPTSQVGSYALVPGGLSSINYELTYADGALSITPATLTVTANDHSRAYGEPNPDFTGTVTGIQNGDAISASYSTTATSTSDVGAYPIVPSLSDADGKLPNYEVQATNGTLTVVQAAQSITFQPLPNRTFGDAPFTVSATATSGLPVSYTVGATDQCTIADATVTITAAGSCTVTASQGGDANYEAAVAIAHTFEISRATATLTLDPATLDQTYDGAAKTVTVATDPGGLDGVSIAYSQAETPVPAPVNAGSYTVVASLTNPNYSAEPVTGTLIIAKATSVITWAEPAGIVYGTALSDLQLNATANVAGTLTYTPAAGAVLDAGADQTLSVVFTPADPTNYDGASTTVLIDVAKADQSLSFSLAALPAKTFGDLPFSIADAASSTSELAVQFSSVTTSKCTVSADGTVTIVEAGDCTVTASQPGNANYNAALSVDQTFTVEKASATLTLAELAHTYDGTAKSATVITAPAGLTGVSVTYDGFPNAPTSAGSYAVVAALDHPNYAAPSASGTLTIAKATPVIVWSAPAAITYGTPLGSTQLNATTSVAGTFTYTPASGTVLNAGAAQPLGAEFTPADAANYEAVAATVHIDVLQATQSITFDPLPNRTYGEAEFSVASAASATSGLTVSFSSGTPASCAVSSTGTVGIVAAGSCTVVASQPGDANHAPAAEVSQSFTIDQATPTITWAAPAPIVYGTALDDAQLAATASVAGTFTYTPEAGTLLNAGPSQALQVTFAPADGNYRTVDATVAIDVLKADQTITFDLSSLPAKSYGDAPFDVSGYASVSSDLLVTLTSSTPATCSLASGTVTILGAGDCTITASQDGDANRNPATSVTRTFAIAKAVTTVSWANPADITYGTALGATQLNATASIAGTLTYSPAAGTVLPPGVGQRLEVSFTPADPANYLGVDETAVFITVNNAVPALSGISPATVVEDGPEFTLTTTGSGFSPASVVRWNGADLATTFVDGSTVRAIVPAATITTISTGYVTVHNGAPGGGTTDPLALFVTEVSSTVTGSDVATSESATGVAEASVGATTATATGSGTVALAQFAENPGAPATFTAVDRYYDISIMSGSSFNELVLEFCDLNGGDELQWYRDADQSWLAVQPTATSSSGCLSFTVTGTSAPSLTDLTGTFFAIARTIQPQSITFDPLPDRTYGDAPFTVSATASSGLPVTFTVGATDQCTIAGATVTITAAGSCTVTASQAGDASYEPAPDVARTFSIAQATPSITWAAPADIQYGTALGNAQLNASASHGGGVVAGAFSYTPGAGTVLAVGSHTLSVLFTPTDAANYATASATVPLTVTKAEQTVSFDPSPLPIQTFGDAAFNVASYAAATSGLPVSFRSATPDRCTVTTSGAVSITDVGVSAAGCAIIVAQEGDASYLAAPEVTRTVDLHNKIDNNSTQTTPSISWGANSQKEFTVTIWTMRSADGSTAFDAQRVNASSLTLTGPGGTGYVTKDNKGGLRAYLRDPDMDGDYDLVLYFAKTDVFNSAGVGSTHTLQLDGALKMVSGDAKRDGRAIRGFDQMRLDP